MDPRVEVATLEDEDGNVVARAWHYVWDEDPERGLPAHRDALNVHDGDWQHVSKAQRLNEMVARYERWADTVLNPVVVAPSSAADALTAAADALALAQQAIEAARFSEQTSPDPGE